ncbi:hypothetical protein SAMN05421505_12728 [Sinosporangium album]|uniref:Uncharacterized protein n=1 Tax=Sinosporangium album TaxID=504805 RepID=A0A1G8GG87_9ACTN|nr:hypothetical protein [Sinosporangium album]SDH93346.1 hypothetical protein SAMN05421505_12728 [Sinosporangium album]
MNDPLAELLGVPGSELARRLRAGLELVDAALRDASTRDGDPGADLYPEVGARLARLLSPSGQSPEGDTPAGTAPTPAEVRHEPARRPTPQPARVDTGPRAQPAPAADPRLDLMERFAKATAEAFGRRPAAAGPGPAWQRFCLDLLRLPAHEARRWRDEAVGLDPGDGAQWDTAPALAEPEPLIHPWPEQGVVGLKTTRGAHPPAELTTALGEAPGAPRLAVLGSLLLALAARDHELYDWASGAGERPLLLSDPQTRDMLRSRLLKRLEAYGRPGVAPEARLLRLVEVDEHLCSVVHLPLAAQESWWSRLWQASRAELTAMRRTVPGAVVRRFDAVGTRMDEIAGWTSGDVRVEGEDGRVLHCLRAYAEAGGKKKPGRVIFGARS